MSSKKPDRVKICVIGAGRWGNNHIKTLHSLGALGGVVENHEATRQERQIQYPDIPFFQDVADAVATGFDGFTVATPAETHYAIAKYILNHGFPVLVEKPVTLNAADARELYELSLEKKATLMVGHVMLFHPAVQKIRELVSSGKIGKLQYLYSNRLNLGRVRQEENILWSFAPHDISIFQYLIGRMPVEVTSTGGIFLQPNIHDTTLTVLKYPGNTIGHIFVSWLHPFKEHRLVIIGSDGMLSYEDSSTDKSLFFYQKGYECKNGVPVKLDGPMEVIPFEQEMPLTREFQYFLSNLDGRDVEIAGGRNGVEVLEILEQATDNLITGVH